MYRVLVVDDEPMIREGLCALIEWEEYGYEVADTAANGQEAVEKCSGLQPDLIIIDIRMPGMNGMEAIATIRERGFRQHVLILSGYADFNYARQAITLRTDGYLLKPVDEEELTANLLRLRAELDQARQHNGEVAVLEQERRLLSLLANETQVPGTGEEPGWRGYELMLIRLLSLQELEAGEEMAFKQAVSRQLHSQLRGIAVLLGPNIVLLAEKGYTATLRRTELYELLESTAAASGQELAVVYGGAVSNWEEVADSYKRAQQGMRRRFFYPAGQLIYAAEVDTAIRESGGEAGKLLLEQEELLSSKLYLALDAGNSEAAAALLKEAGDRLVASGCDEKELKASCMRWVNSVIRKLEQTSAGLRQQHYGAELLALTKEYRYSRYMERLVELLGTLCSELDGLAGGRQMKKMIDMIRRNYRENLKLEALAELFGYSSAYLGKLFKQTTGESFNTYLDKVRMARAKELLSEGLKVYEAAEQVGYTNVDYFHSKFKKYVGTSPSEWKSTNKCMQRFP